MSASAVFALIDCNNFFCSCERIFRPDLRDKPVAVLSNNDGCIIARSQEVKDLGVPMAAPYFKYKDLLKKHKVQVFSSNYQLYGDMSNRVMSILSKFSCDIEFYSIDEAFLRLDQIAGIDYEAYAEQIRNTIKKCTDIPVSIGIGRTKTLAKVAGNIAKKSESGRCIMLDEDFSNQILQQTDISQIWGVGARLAEKFRYSSITTAHQLKNVDPKWARKYYTINGEKMVMELRGISCLEIQDFKPRKNIITSRSFGRKVTDKETLREILSNYAAKACQKLRSQKSRAQGVAIFIRTNRFRILDDQYNKSITQGLDIATNDTSQITKIALKMLDEIFKPGYSYHKCGVILLDLIDDIYQQPNLFFDDQKNQKQEKLMKAIDYLNSHHQSNSVFFASQGVSRNWQLKSDYRSPRYTTSWEEILEVN